MTKVSRTAVKKYARVAYNRFDMCVSTIFSPFAGVLYTVSAFEKDPEKPSPSSSRPSSRASTASSSIVSSRSSSRSSIRDDPPPYSYDVWTFTVPLLPTNLTLWTLLALNWRGCVLVSKARENGLWQVCVVSLGLYCTAASIDSTYRLCSKWNLVAANRKFGKRLATNSFYPKFFFFLMCIPRI